MRIPNDVKKCVVFIGIETQAPSGAKQITFIGTGFFVSVPCKSLPDSNHRYLVTARHIPAEIKGRDFYIRTNTRDGKSLSFPVKGNISWFYHPDESIASDVAVIPFGLQPEYNAQIDIALIPVAMLASDEELKAHDIGEGDEVFIVGLFSYHHGNQRNLPIIRSGNVALISEEKVKTRSFGDMEAYLIEARSLGGLSGSPVFVWKEKHLGQYQYFLLGLMHGHWDIEPEQLLDAADGKKRASVNVGIAIVSPAKHILGILNNKPRVEEREQAEKELAKGKSAN